MKIPPFIDIDQNEKILHEALNRCAIRCSYSTDPNMEETVRIALDALASVQTFKNGLWKAGRNLLVFCSLVFSGTFLGVLATKFLLGY